jgi:hypothetical protein
MASQIVELGIEGDVRDLVFPCAECLDHSSPGGHGRDHRYQGECVVHRRAVSDGEQLVLWLWCRRSPSSSVKGAWLSSEVAMKRTKSVHSVSARCRGDQAI